MDSSLARVKERAFYTEGTAYVQVWRYENRRRGQLIICGYHWGVMSNEAGQGERLPKDAGP